MWLFTKYGFFSVVQNRDNPQVVLVRSRNIEHLTNPKRFADSHEVTILTGHLETSVGTDYPYRMRMNKMHWSRLVEELSHEIDYSNFKNYIEAFIGDEELNKALMKVWMTMRDYQDEVASKRRHHRLKNGPPKKIRKRRKKSTK